jgi:hypothetical protein
MGMSLGRASSQLLRDDATLAGFPESDDRRFP